MDASNHDSTDCVLDTEELAKLDEAIALKGQQGIPMEEAFAKAKMRAKDRLKAERAKTFSLSPEDIAKINQAKRYEEDPGQPLSAVSERIELLLAKYKADQEP